MTITELDTSGPRIDEITLQPDPVKAGQKCALRFRLTQGPQPRARVWANGEEQTVFEDGGNTYLVLHIPEPGALSFLIEGKTRHGRSMTKVVAEVADASEPEPDPDPEPDPEPPPPDADPDPDPEPEPDPDPEPPEPDPEPPEPDPDPDPGPPDPEPDPDPPEPDPEPDPEPPGPHPPDPDAIVLASIEEMLARQGDPVGTVYDVGGVAYDVVDESTLGFNLIDQRQRVFAFIEDLQPFESEHPNSALGGQILPLDCIFGTVSVETIERAVTDYELHGSAWDYTSSGAEHLRLIEHETGVLRDYRSRLRSILDRGGSTFTARGFHATGSRRILRRRMPERQSKWGPVPYWDAAMFGAEVGKDETDLLNWLHQLSRYSDIKGVKYLPGMCYAGTVEYHDEIVMIGDPDAYAVVGLPAESDDDARTGIWKYTHPDQATSTRRLLYYHWPGWGHGHVNRMRSIDFRFDGGSETNLGWRNDPTFTTNVQNAPVHTFTPGNQSGRFVKPDGPIRWEYEGVLELGHTTSNAHTAGAPGRWEFVGMEGSHFVLDTIENWANHGLYGGGGSHEILEHRRYGADIIVYNGDAPSIELWKTDAKRHPRGRSSRLTQFRGSDMSSVFRVGRMEHDLANEFIAVISGSGGVLDLGGGWIRGHGSFRLVSDYGSARGWSGVVGPDEGVLDVLCTGRRVMPFYGGVNEHGEMLLRNIVFRGGEDTRFENRIVFIRANKAHHQQLIFQNVDLRLGANRWLWTDLTGTSPGLEVIFDTCRLPRYNSEPISTRNGRGAIEGLASQVDLDRITVRFLGCELGRVPDPDSEHSNHQLWNAFALMEGCRLPDGTPIPDKTQRLLT